MAFVLVSGAIIYIYGGNQLKNSGITAISEITQVKGGQIKTFLKEDERDMETCEILESKLLV